MRKVQTTLTRIFIVLESVSHGLSENWDEISRKSRKFKGFFRPKSGDLQKKKVFTEVVTDFSAKFGNSNVSGGLFSCGGAIFNFSHKISLKSTKNVRFCILHKPMGGPEPPPASPLATLLNLSYWENTKVPPLSRPTVNLLNALVAQSIFCNFSGNNITAVSGNWNVLAIIVRPIFVLRFVKVQLAGHLWDLSQSSANARVSISPNKFRFCGWGIESQTFIIKFLCVTVIQNYQSGSKKKALSKSACVKKEKMNTAISMSTKILVMKLGVIMQLNLIDYKELTQTAWGEESIQ